MQHAQALAEVHPSQRDKMWDRLWWLLAGCAVLAFIGWGVSSIARIDKSSATAAVHSSAAANYGKSAAKNSARAARNSSKALTVSQLNRNEIARQAVVLGALNQDISTGHTILRLLQGELGKVKTQVSYQKKLLAYFEQNLTALCQRTHSPCRAPPATP